MGALTEYSTQLETQIEDGPFSETFTIDPSGVATEVKGIFDNSYDQGDRDQGNVRQQHKKPRVILASVPSGVTARATQIEVRSQTYTIQKIDEDGNEAVTLWLVG